MEGDDNFTVCREIVHSHTYLLFAQLVNGALTTVCVLVGTIGNLHSIKSIHMSNFDKNRGVVLAVSILALAFWDTILLWCAFFYYGVKALTRAYSSDTMKLLTPWFHGFSQISNTASIWCVAAITVQRYMASRDPFRGSRSSRVLLKSYRGDRRSSSLSMIYCSTYRRHFRLPVLLSLAALTLNMPAFFEIDSFVCRRYDGKFGYDLRISSLRLNPYYQIWYKVVFRMLMTSCAPNIFILLMTGLTVYLLKGTNRSRRQLFHMSDSLTDSYNSKETIQTLISLMLVIKYLVFRTPSFFLDVIEVTVGYSNWMNVIIYFVDLSNFFVILNSATNCLILLKGNEWLQQHVEHRNTLRKKKLLFENLQTAQRVALLHTSWVRVLGMTSGQFGVRVLYSMLRKNPALYEIFATGTHETTESDEESSLKDSCQAEAARSFDLLKSPLYQEIGDRIMTFIGELILMMKERQPEQEIISRIRLAGGVHYDKKIVLNSALWKEFKATTLTIVGECPYESDVSRMETLDAWNSLISLIIREMKNGFWMSGRVR